MTALPFLSRRRLLAMADQRASELGLPSTEHNLSEAEEMVAG